jgi:hypothetical protein
MSRFLTDLMSKPKAQEKLQLEIVPAISEGKQENSTNTSTPTTMSASRHSSTSENNFPIAPVNNFQKVTNTITKEAIPQRLFKTGKTKEIYDVLYSLTRGAITPERSITVSKPRLCQLTGVGSRVTIDACLGYLELVGLVRIAKNVSGRHEGNEYEIFTPEEIRIDIHTSTPTSTPTSRGTSPPQTLGVVPPLVSGGGSRGSESINTGLSEVPNTLLKTNTNDDDAFTLFIENFQGAAKEITGKKLSKKDAEKLKELSDLLILELKMAARRTENISSVPAFLTEVLRRKLRDLPAVPIRQSKVKKDAVGKSESDEYKIKTLDEKSRESALEQLREFAADEFLQDFKKWYTEEDWNWLIKELGIN